MRKVKTPDDFAQMYDAYITTSSRMYRRAKRLDYKTFLESSSDVWDSVSYSDVHCVEIHMPEDRFKALIDDLNWIRDVVEKAGFSSHAADAIIDRESEEHKLRNEFPALDIAYNKYLTLLRLCGGSR